METAAVALFAVTFKLVLTMTFHEPVTSLHDLHNELNLIKGAVVAATRVRRQDTTLSTDSTTLDPNTTPTPTTLATTAAPPGLFWPGTPGFECSTELYKRYNSKCCSIPSLLENSMIKKCNVINRIPFGVQRDKKFVKIVFKGAVGAKKNPSILASIDQICLAHCIFKNERWLGKDNRVDLQFLYSSLGVILPPSYLDQLNKAVPECSQTVSTGDVFANVTNYFGKTCFVTPAKVLRCIKRFMMINCTAVLDSGKQCGLDLNRLKACDPMLL